MAHDYENTTTSQDESNPHAEEWQAFATGEHSERLEKQAGEAAVREIMLGLHDAWRAPYSREDGSYEPQRRETVDRRWIETHSINTVDVANTDVEFLPEDWRQKLRFEAEVFYAQMRLSGFDWKARDAEGRYTDAARMIAAAIHGVLSSPEGGEPEKAGGLVPFDRLSPEGQDKYLRQLECVYRQAHEDQEAAYEIRTDELHAHYNKYGRLLKRTFRETGERY